MRKIGILFIIYPAAATFVLTHCKLVSTGFSCFIAMLESAVVNESGRTVLLRLIQHAPSKNTVVGRWASASIKSPVALNNAVATQKA